MPQSLLHHSVQTLAWLGDAHFERYIRLELAKRGDFPSDRLERARVKLVRAETQAEILQSIESELEEREADFVRRGRNAKLRRGVRDVRMARHSTAFEVLIALWWLDDKWERFATLVEPGLQMRLERALESSEKLKRG